MMAEKQSEHLGVDQIRGALTTRTLTMEGYITQLKDRLTSTDSDQRAEGFENLYKVLLGLPDNYLNEIEVNYLAHFFASFLQDHYVLSICLKCLYCLVDNYRLSDEEVSYLFSTLHKEVPLNQQPIDDRFTAYQLIGKLLEKHLQCFQVSNYDFIIGFIQMVEGERDPRCLLVILQLFQRVASNIELGHLDEELFEIISCYFPITYSPPPDAKLPISRDDLSRELENCFKSSAKFGPYAIPVLLEKLESELSSSRIDSYIYISTCASVYGAKCWENFLDTFWVSVRVDTLKQYTKPTSLMQAAVSSLSSVVKTVATEESMVDKFLQLVLEDLESSLKKIELQLLTAAVKILVVFSSIKESLWKRVFEFALPILLEQYSFRQAGDQAEILQAISSLSEEAQECKFTVQSFAHEEAVLHICFDAQSSQNLPLSEAAFRCAKTIVSGPWLLSESGQLLVSKKLLEVFSTGISDNPLVGNSYDLLRSFALKYNDVVKKHVLSFLFGILEDHEDNKTSPELIVKAINAAKAGVVDGLSTKKYISFAVTIINNTVKASWDESDMVYDSVCKALKDVIGKTTEEQLVYDCCLIPLLKTIAHLCLCDDSPEEVLEFQSNRMSTVFELLPSVIRRLSKKHSVEFLDAVTGLILRHSYTKLLPEPPPSCHCDLKKNMEKEIFLEEPYFQILIRLIHVLFVNVNLNFDVPESERIGQKLLFFIHHKDENVVSFSIQALVALLNKLMDERASQLTGMVLNEIHRLHEDDSSKKAIDLLTWSHKALVLSTKPCSRVLTEEFLRTMTERDDESAWRAAQGLVFLHEPTNCLNKENNANVSLFYQQKFYVETLPSLMDGFAKHEGERKQAFAYAILGQLKHLSKNLLKCEVKKLRNIITFGLQEGNEQNQEMALESVTHIITSDPAFVRSSIESVTLQLVALLQNKAPLQVRKRAAECLGCISRCYEERLLLPLRNKVVNVLALKIDDNKRIVRYAAADAKLKWILIGQPK